MAIDETEQSHLPVSICQLWLTARAFNALYRANIFTINKLIGMSDKELLRIQNFGPTSLMDTKDALRKYILDHTTAVVKE